jgi:PadR family transcriptional regulator, regulatory protein PadR
MGSSKGSLVQGTLDMIVLKILEPEPLHGYGIGVRIEQVSKGVFQVNGGSLFPALRRLERDGLIKGDWRTTDNNRRAKWYVVTARGRAKLRQNADAWEAQVAAIGRILRPTARSSSGA